MHTVLLDLRFAVRLFLKNPLFTAAVVITLGVAIGANTAVFSVMNAILFPPFPYQDSDRLVDISEEGSRMSITNYDDWWHDANFFESLGAYKVKAWNFSGEGEPAKIPGYSVSSSFLNVLQMDPILGRGFSKEDDVPGAPFVVIISEEMWRAVFNADQQVIGKVIRLDGEPCTVIGVMPERFRFPTFPVAQPQFWSTLGHERAHQSPTAGKRVSIIGRLKPGITMAEAQQRLNGIAANIKGPPGYKMNIARINPFGYRYKRAGASLLFMSAAVLFVLLIACSNIANLFLARAVIRKREVAVRIALGASKSRLMRQFLTESVLLCSAGAICGLLLTIWLHDSFTIWIDAIYPASVNYWTGVYPNTIHPKVFIFAAGIAIITGLSTGMAPALEAWRTDVNSSLKEGGISASTHFRGKQFHHFFVVLQIALSLVLVTGAALMLQSMSRLQRVDLGFNPEFLEMDVSLPSYKYAEPKQWTSFCYQLLDRVRQLPGVQHAAISTALPLEDGKPVSIRTEEQANLAQETEPVVEYNSITPEFFDAVGGTLIMGRGLNERDGEAASKVVLVNQAFVQRFWPGENPLGRRIHLEFDSPVSAEVVGVVHDMKQGIDSPVEPQIFIPFRQQPFLWLTLVVKASNMTLIAPLLSKEALAVDNVVPVFGPEMMTRVVEKATAERRLAMLLLSVFSGVALCLSIVGIYGLLHYSTARQTHEIGIRISLGAQKIDITKMILRQATVLALAGISAGLLLSLGLNRILESFLYGISKTDPATYAGVVVMIFCVALAASCVPALRAGRIDPVKALREE